MILAMKKNVARIIGTRVEPLIIGGPLSGVMSHVFSYKRLVAIEKVRLKTWQDFRSETH